MPSLALLRTQCNYQSFQKATKGEKSGSEGEDSGRGIASPLVPVVENQAPV